MNKKLTKNIIASFLMFLFSFGAVNACGKIATTDIAISNEKGSFYISKESSSIKIDNEKYPGTVEVFINNEKIQALNNQKNNSTYYYFDQYASSWFPKNILISIRQDGKEIYSARVKVYDTTYSWGEKILTPILVISIFLTLVIITWGIISSFFDKWKIKLKIIFILIGIDILLGILLIFWNDFC